MLLTFLDVFNQNQTNLKFQTKHKKDLVLLENRVLLWFKPYLWSNHELNRTIHHMITQSLKCEFEILKAMETKKKMKKKNSRRFGLYWRKCQQPTHLISRGHSLLISLFQIPSNAHKIITRTRYNHQLQTPILTRAPLNPKPL